MTLAKNLKLAALASAAMPNVAVAGVRESGQDSATDDRMGIIHAVVQDASGRGYDVFASDRDAGRKRLLRRAKAARTLERSRAVGGLGFATDRVVAFCDAGEKSATGDHAVLVVPYAEGEARQLDLLTLEDASSVGTAIGAIHRQSSGFLTEHHYPTFTTGQIRAQLTAWIKRLQQAGHVPPAITSSWARIIETDGLWSFSTCLVHGGFMDGDFIFSGSSITAVSNWQNMQVNDPARDLAWMFAKMDDAHRSALMGSYGRMLGAHSDGLIMLRANLWLQMEQVGDFIEALNQADNAKITRFKAQVEHLAHQLTVVTNRATSASSQAIAATVARQAKPARDDEDDDSTNASNPVEADDATGESDATGSAEILHAQEDSTASRPVAAAGSTAHPKASAHSARASRPTPDMPSPSSSATMVLTEAGKASAVQEPLDRHDAHRPDDSAPTTLIPLLEREERALHDAQAGLEEYEEREGERRHDAEAEVVDSTSGREEAVQTTAPQDDDVDGDKADTDAHADGTDGGSDETDAADTTSSSDATGDETDANGSDSDDDKDTATDDASASENDAAGSDTDDDDDNADTDDDAASSDDKA
nr:phosphotransferase [Bifidobacterium sp. ESL0763]